MATSDGAIGRPAPALRPYVERYAGYRMEGYGPGIHRGLPSHTLTLGVSMADPVDMARMPDPTQAPAAMMTLLGGLHASAVTIRHDGSQYGVHLNLTPLGSRAFFGLPASELASTVVDLRDVLGREAASLPERLRELSTWELRFAALDDLLARRVREPAGPRAEVSWAWTRLLATAGEGAVADLAAEVGWSRRHLGELFRRELGLAPKLAARVLRFERACRMLQRDPRPSIADVAAICGYFDQAHLTRDWNDLCGCTPTVWMAEELPSVQDTGAERRAS